MPAFPKGVSGNPGGRPKVVAIVRALASKHSAKAITTLAKIMNDTGEDARARVAACNALLDRAAGKPQMSVEVTEPPGTPPRTILMATAPPEKPKGKK